MDIPTTPGTTHRGRLAAAVLALALLVFGLSAPDALAGTNQAIQTEKGSVYFDHYGEYLTACDKKYDGQGVRAYLYWSSTKTGKVTDYDSYGGETLCEGVNLSIPEGTTVWLQMCYTDNKVDVKCSKTQRAEA